MDIYTTATVLGVAFLMLFSYRQGIKDGQRVKDNKPLQKIANLPVIEKKKDTKDLTIEEQIANLASYQPGAKDGKD